MNRSLKVALTRALAPLLLTISAAAPAWPQGTPPAADNRPEVKESLEQLGKHAAARGKEDDQAVALIDKLLVEFPKSGPKDRDAIAKGLGKCFDVKRVAEEGEDAAVAFKMFTAAATALGKMGPESVKPLVAVLGDKSHKANQALLRTVILSLGQTRELTAKKPLLDLLDHHDRVLQGATAQALGDFDGAPDEVRKEIFLELLKIIMALKTQVDSDPNDVVARERYDAVSGAIITSLQRLSGHEERDPEAFERWWNKNKKADWPDKTV